MLIEARNPKTPPEESNYFTLTGNIKLARVLQKVQSGMIAAGNELENTIFDQYAGNKEKSMKIQDFVVPSGDMLLHHFKIPRGFKGREKGATADFVFITEEKAYVFEVKAGKDFDTKKSKAEIDSGQEIAELFEEEFGLKTEFRMILWNCNDSEASGVKDKRIKNHLMMRPEFCALLGISEEKINSQRTKYQGANLRFFLDMALEIAPDAGLLEYYHEKAGKMLQEGKS